MKYEIIEVNDGLYVVKVLDFWWFGGRYFDNLGLFNRHMDSAATDPFRSIQEAEDAFERKICRLEELKKFPRTVKVGQL